MNSTHLIFICPRLSGTGGTETALVKAANCLIDDYSVKIILPNKPDNNSWIEKLNDYVEFIQVDLNNPVKRMLYLVNVFLHADEDDCFVILAANVIRIATLVRRVFRKEYKVASWIHYSLDNQQMFNPQNILSADRHWAISSCICNQLMDRGIINNKIDLIYNAVDEYHGSLNAPVIGSGVRLVFIGRIELYGQKNLFEMLTAIAQSDYPVSLDLYGTVKDQQEWNNVVKSLKIENKIHMHGWVVDPWEDALMNVHPTAVVLTSKFEGLPMAFLEGLCRGVPAISADFDGVTDIVENGVNGYIYHRGNIAALCEAIKALEDTHFAPEEVAATVDKFSLSKYQCRLENAVKKLENDG